MTDNIVLTVEEFERYAPYYTFPEFCLGFHDYSRGNAWHQHVELNGVAGQAYDRGAECAMRRSRRV